MKEFIQSSQHRLGLVDVPSKRLSEDGNLFLLRSCIRYNGPLSQLQRDLFIYAVRASTPSPSSGTETFGDARTSEVISLVADNLLPKQYRDLEWFLDQRSGLFPHYLKVMVKEGERETALMKLAVAAGFPALIRKFKDSVSMEHLGLLHTVVAGPFYDIDRESIIRYLVAEGCPVDEHHGYSFVREYRDSSYFGLVKVTALTLAIILKDIDESTRQRIVSVLLELGADPLTSADAYAPWTYSSKDHFNPLGLSVMRSNAAIVRLLLEIVSNRIPNGQGWQLYRAALIRGEKDIVQTLIEFGLNEDIKFYNTERYPIQDMLIYSSLCMTAPVGRPSYLLPLDRRFLNAAAWEGTETETVNKSHPENLSLASRDDLYVDVASTNSSRGTSLVPYSSP